MIPTQRTLSYVDAILEATREKMKEDPSVVVFGLDVDDPKAIQGTVRGLVEEFGSERIFGTPLSEDAMTGAAIGMAMAGLKPIHIHIRMDFLMLAMNQIINMAAKSSYMYGGRVSIPLVIRSMIGKSWGQGPQHSQGLYSFFMHVPGLKVVAPTTPYDAKGCLRAAIEDGNPVLFIEHRLLHFQQGFVPQSHYSVAPGTARITAPGKDVTLVGISAMQVECLKARELLMDIGIEAEVIDPIWLSPLDTQTICGSVKKTKKLLVVDNGWTRCGAGAEILSQVMENLQDTESIRVGRMGYADVTCPTTPTLEALYYPEAKSIASEARRLVDGTAHWISTREQKTIEFRGPF